jgi:glycosyltransferase involved in cell wall biosynthesis
MSKIVTSYEIGEILESNDPEEIARQISQLLYNETRRNHYIQNLKKAANELCWENEEALLEKIFNEIR